MGAFISTAASNSASKPCTTSTTSHLATSTSLPVLVIKTSSVATTTSSVAVKTSSTSTTTSSAPTSTSTFYLKSSCDYSCLGHYAADDQVYSNVFSSNSTDFDAFYLSNNQLYDASTGTLCVASEAGGTSTQLQCSGDLDYVNGVAVVGGFGSSSNVLTYNGTSSFYGCGVLDLAESYEPTGLTYFTAEGDPSVCRMCTFSLVPESECNVQDAALVISTSVLAPYTVTTSQVATSTPTTLATTTTTGKPCTTGKAASTTTTSIAAATTPKSCGTGYCKVQWFPQPDCYWQDCRNCPSGTKCQQYQFWPFPVEHACLPAL